MKEREADYRRALVSISVSKSECLAENNDFCIQSVIFQHAVIVVCDFQGSVKEMLNLSQQDYVKRIEELNQALINAWDADHRVKALKIAIQVYCAFIGHLFMWLHKPFF